jgi:hypothetical protein
MEPAQGPINKLLLWLIHYFGYNTAIFIKDTIPTLSAVMIGFVLGIFVMAYVLKDTRLVPDPTADRMFVTQLVKNHQRKLFITVPEKEAGRIPLITGMVLYLNAALVKFFPIKRIQFVNTLRIRIMFIVLLIIVIVVCLFTIIVDYHSILPDGHGGYKVYEFNY